MPLNLEIIETIAFFNCRKLKHLELPETIEYIRLYSFEGTPFYDQIRVDDKNGGTYIESILVSIDKSHYSDTSNFLLGSRKMSVKKGTKTISVLACNMLKVRKIELPEGLEYIEQAAFSNCFYLKDLKLPKSLKKIGPGAFANCYRLKTVKIPENVTEIGRNIFYGCNKLKKIEIPQHLKDTFYYDGNAEVIYY